MNRIALALLVLLIGTNVFWFIASDRGASRSLPTRPDEVNTGSGDSRPPLNLKGVTMPDGGAGLPAGADAPGPVTPEQGEQLVKAWVKAIKEPTDALERQSAIDGIFEAVSGGDPSRHLVGLRTLPWIQGERFDQRAFKPRVANLLYSADAKVRKAAVLAFTTLGIGRGDIDKLLPMTKDRDRDVRKEIPRAILKANDYEAEGMVASVFVDLLHDDDLSVQLAALRALEGSTRMAPELEMELIPLIDSGDEHLSFRALAALAGAKLEKDPEVIQVLLANLGNEDPKFRTEARKGLAEGVPDPYGPQIADLVTPLLSEQGDLGDQHGNVELLAEYGTGVHVEALEKLSNDGSVPELVRRAAREAIEKIKSRGNR